MNAEYILGTVEYLLIEIDVDGPGATFVPADWTAEVALVAIGDEFDDDADPSIWTSATLETIDTKDYAKLVLGDDVSPAAGTYQAFVRLTKTVGGTEIPLVKARGEIVLRAG